VFVGIAGGLKTVSLGDVVVASHVYQLGHRSEAERAFSREKSIPGDQFLTQVATRISVDRADLYVGPIVAGDILLKNSRSDVAAWIREHQNDALAIEMEGWGFSWSAHASAIPSLVVRGISDLIDGKNDEHDAKWQPAAAEAAASAAIAILAGGIQLRPRG
jgi:nucleoside phosphorylase